MDAAAEAVASRVTLAVDSVADSAADVALANSVAVEDFSASTNVAAEAVASSASLRLAKHNTLQSLLTR